MLFIIDVNSFVDTSVSECTELVFSCSCFTLGYAIWIRGVLLLTSMPYNIKSTCLNLWSIITKNSVSHLELFVHKKSLFPSRLYCHLIPRKNNLGKHFSSTDICNISCYITCWVKHKYFKYKAMHILHSRYLKHVCACGQAFCSTFS